MLCSDCKVDEATEFLNEFGLTVKQGKCRPCYERAVRNVAINEQPIRGRGGRRVQHRANAGRNKETRCPTLQHDTFRLTRVPRPAR